MLLKVVLFVLFGLVLQHVAKIVITMGFHKTVYSHQPGTCRIIPGIDFGSEDIHLLPNGLAFISSGCRVQNENPVRGKFYEDNKVKGRLFLFNFKNPQKNVQELKIESSKGFERDQFYPHGLSVWRDDKSGKTYLFVIAHPIPTGDDRVEKFEYIPEKTSLKHLKTYRSDTMISLNNIVAVGEDSFYIVNSFGSKSKFVTQVQMFGMFRWSNVVLHDSNNYAVVADGMRAGSGIALSNDGKYVYASDLMSSSIIIYNRAKNNSLTLKEDYVLHTLVDNVSTDPETGDIYIGAHPIAHLVFAGLDDPAIKSPSQVLHLRMKDGHVTGVSELFMDADGSFISASSVAVVYKKQMLIGTVQDKLAFCDINMPLSGL